MVNSAGSYSGVVIIMCPPSILLPRSAGLTLFVSSRRDWSRPNSERHHENLLFISPSGSLTYSYGWVLTNRAIHWCWTRCKQFPEALETAGPLCLSLCLFFTTQIPLHISVPHLKLTAPYSVSDDMYSICLWFYFFCQHTKGIPTPGHPRVMLA